MGGPLLLSLTDGSSSAAIDARNASRSAQKVLQDLEERKTPAKSRNYIVAQQIGVSETHRYGRRLQTTNRQCA